MGLPGYEMACQLSHTHADPDREIDLRGSNVIPAEDEAFGHFLAAGSLLPDKSMTSQLALGHAQGGRSERRGKGPQG